MTGLIQISGYESLETGSGKVSEIRSRNGSGYNDTDSRNGSGHYEANSHNCCQNCQSCQSCQNLISQPQDSFTHLLKNNGTFPKVNSSKNDLRKQSSASFSATIVDEIATRPNKPQVQQPSCSSSKLNKPTLKVKRSGEEVSKPDVATAPASKASSHKASLTPRKSVPSLSESFPINASALAQPPYTCSSATVYKTPLFQTPVNISSPPSALVIGPIDFAPDAMSQNKNSFSSPIKFEDVLLTNNSLDSPMNQPVFIEAEVNIKRTSALRHKPKALAGITSHQTTSSLSLNKTRALQPTKLVTPEVKRNRRRSKSLDAFANISSFSSSSSARIRSSRIAPSSASKVAYTHLASPLTFQNTSSASSSIKFSEKLFNQDGDFISRRPSEINNDSKSPNILPLKPTQPQSASSKATQSILLPDPLRETSKKSRRPSDSTKASGPTKDLSSPTPVRLSSTKPKPEALALSDTTKQIFSSQISAPKSPLTKPTKLSSASTSIFQASASAMATNSIGFVVPAVYDPKSNTDDLALSHNGNLIPIETLNKSFLNSNQKSSKKIQYSRNKSSDDIFSNDFFKPDGDAFQGYFSSPSTPTKSKHSLKRESNSSNDSNNNFSYSSLASDSGSSTNSSTPKPKNKGHRRSRSSSDFDTTWIERRKTLLGNSSLNHTVTSLDDNMGDRTDAWRLLDSNRRLLENYPRSFSPVNAASIPVKQSQKENYTSKHKPSTDTSLTQVQSCQTHTDLTKKPSVCAFSAANSSHTTLHSSTSSFKYHSSTANFTSNSNSSSSKQQKKLKLSKSTMNFETKQPTRRESLPTPVDTDLNVQKKLRTKYNCIRELISTEENFAKDLNIVLSVYVKFASIQPYSEYLDNRDLITLFGNISSVLAASQHFVKRLHRLVPSYIAEECSLDASDPDNLLKDVPSNIGIVFLDYLPMMEKPFKEYCVKNKHQMNTFYRIKNIACPTIEKWLLECNELCKPVTAAWSLDSLLIKPVQRLLKYPLLLSSILKNTPESHSDYLSLKHALREIESCAQGINNEADGASPISPVAIEHSFTDTPPSPESVTFSPDDSPASSNSSAASSVSANNPPFSFNSPEHNNMMELLKENSDADLELNNLIEQFKTKNLDVKKFVDAINNHVCKIQNHFDVTNSLAHYWMNWGALMDDDVTSSTLTIDEPINTFSSLDDTLETTLKRALLSIKKYRRYSMFCSPFTTASFAHASTNRLKNRVDIEVLPPIYQVLNFFKRVEGLIEERARLHVPFQKYIAQKNAHNSLSTSTPFSSSGLSSSSSSFSSMTEYGPEFIMRRNADRFWLIHTKLKTELPALFNLSKKMAETCLIKFLDVQKDWFRNAVDSTSNAFQLRLEDIQQNSINGDPIVSSFLSKSKTNVSKRIIEQELKICRKVKPYSMKTLKDSRSFSSLSSSGESAAEDSFLSNEETVFDESFSHGSIKSVSPYKSVLPSNQGETQSTMDTSFGSYDKSNSKAHSTPRTIHKKASSHSFSRLYNGKNDDTDADSNSESEETKHDISEPCIKPPFKGPNFTFNSPTHYIPKKARSQSQPHNTFSSTTAAAIQSTVANTTASCSPTPPTVKTRTTSLSGVSSSPPKPSMNSSSLAGSSHSRFHTSAISSDDLNDVTPSHDGQPRRHVRRKSSLGALSSLLPHKLMKNNYGSAI